ncbi:MAG: glycosyltransferase family 1 protein, partial [Kiritimatiellia bacterium]
VCSNAGSLPEIVGDAALVASPYEVGILADHCVRVLRDPDAREHLVAAGQKHAAHFNRLVFAEGLLQIYNHVSVKQGS